jgi:hypothetical protein
MPERRSLAAIALCLVTLGCGRDYQERMLAKISARRIGCPPEEAVVSDIHRSGSRPRTWDVTCEEQGWECQNVWGRVTCTPLGAAAIMPASR